ncbi:DUF4202 domain-containing protein [Lentisphaera profundi]|uniref:DUF4202 domain-containing protein n=1 Tax=Lentisphaera profundi TaxID=1658616 RepID=A0ABY7VYU2_9BACT|nr:DUF4202 domain-containing protein [Lentisphaera profundi]WDE98365.1 DUF4202 domain-containing protein [Lentisphaera profundi]
MSNYAKAVSMILDKNQLDPDKKIIDDQEVGANVLYSKYMGEWQEKLYPEVVDAVKLAARAQHICRWELKRVDFPEGKAGYFKWRTTLAKLHAQILSEIMDECDYSLTEIDRAKEACQKKNFKNNEDSQCVEDCACMVFLNYYFDDFIAKHSDERLIDIVGKTWGKMSEKAHDAALKLDLSEKALSIVKAALGA